MAADSEFVKIRQLSFNRGDKCIFKGIDLNIHRGQIVAIMGPSGTGKTTLLRLIGGQLTPDEGVITIDDQNVHALSRKALFVLRRKLGMLFQSGALFTNLSVYENVAFPLREHTALSEDFISELVLLKLQSVGLRGAKDLMPSELSGGMSRRVALARAMALDPKLMMYDEPFTGQDPITKGVLVKLIKSMNEFLDLTSIIVSHDVEETLSISDYVYLLSDNVIIGEGTPEMIRKNDSEQVQQFIHGLADGPVAFHYPAKDLEADLMGELE